MYLSAQDIANSRVHSLHNLLGLSSTCLQASQRLIDLLGNISRDSVQRTSKHWANLGHGQVDSLVGFPAALWLDGLAHSNQLMESATMIFGEVHKDMIRNTEAQVRVFDEIVFASIRHTRKSSPWETGMLLDTAQTSLHAAEQTLSKVSRAAIESIDSTGKSVQEIAQTLTSDGTRSKRPSVRNTASDNH